MPVDETKNWTDLTVSAFAALGRGRTNDAARLWLQAAAVVDEATSTASIIAASHSNAGIAHLILENRREADVDFREADERWSEVIESVATLDIPMTGSSSFHFRLATKVPQLLIEAGRRRYRHIAEAAQAITRFNRLFVDADNLASGLVDREARELASTLGEILGSASAEVCLLTMTSERADDATIFSHYNSKIADFAHRQPALASALSADCAAFEKAVALTALLGPRAFSAIERQKENAETRFENSNVTRT